jgi:multisubunit Na+/H+ antiporter MnhF subunit
LPADYTLTAQPALQKTGESNGRVQYEASFEGVPADLLRISTVMSPTPWDNWAPIVELLVAIIVGLIVGVVLGLLCRAFIRWRQAWIVIAILAFVATPILATIMNPVVMELGPLRVANSDLSNPGLSLFCGLIALVYGLIAPILAAAISALLARQGNSTSSNAGHTVST